MVLVHVGCVVRALYVVRAVPFFAVLVLLLVLVVGFLLAITPEHQPSLINGLSLLLLDCWDTC